MGRTQGAEGRPARSASTATGLCSALSKRGLSADRRSARRFIPNRDGLDLATSFSLLPSSASSSGSGTPTSPSKSKRKVAGADGDAQTGGWTTFGIFPRVRLINLHSPGQKKRTGRSTLSFALSSSAQLPSTRPLCFAPPLPSAQPSTPPRLHRTTRPPPRNPSSAFRHLRGSAWRETRRTVGWTAQRTSGTASVPSGRRVRGCCSVRGNRYGRSARCHSRSVASFCSAGSADVASADNYLLLRFSMLPSSPYVDWRTRSWVLLTRSEPDRTTTT